MVSMAQWEVPMEENLWHCRSGSSGLVIREFSKTNLIVTLFPGVSGRFCLDSAEQYNLRSRAKISCSKNQSHDGNGAVIPLVDTRGSDENDLVIFARDLRLFPARIPLLLKFY